jgi:microcystin-dependent protein
MAKYTDPDHNNILSLVLETVFPVGAVYTNLVDETSPKTIFGIGEWEKIEGKVIVGASESDSDFAIGVEGGEKSHKLTTTELPAHNHSVTINAGGAHTHTYSFWMSDEQGSWKNPFRGNDHNEELSKTFTTSSSGSHTHGASIGNTGGNASHNNLQPYVTAHMWKRIS